MKKLNHMSAFDYINYALIILLCVIFLYPVFLTLSISFSDPKLSAAKVVFLPKGFTVDSYKYLLSNAKLARYYLNTVFYAVTATIFFLLITALTAYPLIISDLKGKKAISIFMTITMFFDGGLIPTYFLIKGLHMTNTIWVMIVPFALSAFNVIIFRTFFTGIAQEVRESASIDGAGHFLTLFRIVLPISKPLLATFALFSMVGKWNDYITAVIYLNSDDLMPVQILLRKMIVQMDFKSIMDADRVRMFSMVSPRSVKSALAVITILPIMCVYPFMQKYFAKGMMVGSVKS